MDSERRSLIATAIVGIIVLAIIIGSIYYLIQFIRGRQSGQSTVTNQTRTVKPTATSSATIAVNQASPTNNQPDQRTQGNQSTDFKVFNEGDFQITYLKNWGLLTCNNSSNIELDPTNSTDMLKVRCEKAVKPITVLKNSIGCANGQNLTLGSHQVLKTKATEGSYTRYEWCVKSVPPLYITHRTSGSNDQASSKEDYSKQIEELISRISFVRGS